MEYIQSTLLNLVQQTAFLNLTFGNMIMIFVAYFTLLSLLFLQSQPFKIGRAHV